MIKETKKSYDEPMLETVEFDVEDIMTGTDSNEDDWGMGEV